MVQRLLLRCAVIVTAALAALPAFGQLRVVTYNTKDRPVNTTDFNWLTALDTLNTHEAAGIAKRVDIFALQEIPNLGIAQNLATMMNNLTGAGTYTAAVGSWGDGWNLQGFVYDSSTVDFLGLATLPAGTRPTVRGHFRPAGYTSPDAEFYVFSSHLKAFPGFEWHRAQEAAAIRNWGDQLGDGASIIYAGDYNLTSGLSEGAYTTMLQPGPGQAFDPVNGAFSYLDFTYSSTGPFNRLDFQFISGELLDGEGLNYIDGTYRVVGPVIRGTRHLVEPWELGSASDHLPVVADYQVPAAMSANVVSHGTAAIVGGTLTANVTVENTASAVVSHGADILTYTIGGTAVVSTIAGSALALDGEQAHSVSLDTSAPGLRLADIEIVSTRKAVQNPFVSEQVAYVVLDHATASLNNVSEHTAAVLDLGTVHWGSDVSSTVALYNLASASGFTAALSINGAWGAGDTGVIGIELPQELIAAGEYAEAMFIIDTFAMGAHSATWSIATADQALPGAMAGNTLSIQIDIEIVVPLLGDFNGDGALSGLDIPGFKSALADPCGWALANPSLPHPNALGDFNGDGVFSGLDIPGFKAALAGNTVVVPEPATLLLIGLCAMPLIKTGVRSRMRLGRFDH